jgi:hypothetical protein
MLHTLRSVKQHHQGSLKYKPTEMHTKMPVIDNPKGSELLIVDVL